MVLCGSSPTSANKCTIPPADLVKLIQQNLPVDQLWDDIKLQTSFVQKGSVIYSDWFLLGVAHFSMQGNAMWIWQGRELWKRNEDGRSCYASITYDNTFNLSRANLYSCGIWNLIITVPADALVPNGTRPSAGTLLMTNLNTSFTGYQWVCLTFGPDNIIQNGLKNLNKYHGTPSVLLVNNMF